MKHVTIEGIRYPVTVCPPRVAHGARAGNKATVQNGRHFALMLPCHASHPVDAITHITMLEQEESEPC